MPEISQTLTEDQLFARLKRRLKRDGLTLRKCSERSRWHGELGRYYATRGERLEMQHIELDQLQAELEAEATA